MLTKLPQRTNALRYMSSVTLYRRELTKHLRPRRTAQNSDCAASNHTLLFDAEFTTTIWCKNTC